MKTINYTGNSKLITRIVHLLNRKAPLPLDGQGDAEWGTNGQVLTTDGNGNTSWTTPQGGGGDVTDVEVNGTSVVNAQGVAEVSVPTKTSDLNNDSGFIDGTDLSTALSDYTPTSGLAAVATSGSYNDLSNKPTLATVATSGSYNDLSNKPTIPAAQVNSDWNAVSGVAEILNKPTIPTALSDLSEDTTHRVVTDTEKTAWNGKVSDNPTFTEAATRANIASGESFATILGKIKKFFTDLATVAFTGAYSDLSGTPDLTNVAYKNVNNQFSANQNINRADGTTETDGTTTLVIGNNISSGTAGNSRGRVFLYGTGVRGTYIVSNASSSNKTVTIPNASGNVALNSINNNFSASQIIDARNGTTSAVGYTNLNIGNDVAAGTAGNSTGVLRLYGDSGSSTALLADNATASRMVRLPNGDGTLALTSDLAPSSETLIQSIEVNGSVNYTPASNGFISLKCAGGTAGQTIRAIVRDANITSYGVTIQATVDAYTNEPIGYLPVKQGRTYQIRNTSTSTREINAYFCN